MTSSRVDNWKYINVPGYMLEFLVNQEIILVNVYVNKTRSSSSSPYSDYYITTFTFKHRANNYYTCAYDVLEVHVKHIIPVLIKDGVVIEKDKIYFLTTNVLLRLL